MEETPLVGKDPVGLQLPSKGRRKSPLLRLALAIVGVVAVALGAFVAVGGLGSSPLGAMVDLEGPYTAGLHARLAGRGHAVDGKDIAQGVAERLLDAPRFDQVTYKIQSGGSLDDVARVFAMDAEDLRALNPDIVPDSELAPGARVFLYKDGVALSEVEPRTEERLHAAIPITDGPGRRIRRRIRSWGIRTTVQSLDRALRVYAEAFPKGPVVIVSDMSRRMGGRLKPHHTHREGRDVDLSYIPRPEHDNGGFLLMDERTFDAERNWTFYRALIATGKVDVILMDRRLQKLLRRQAESEGLAKSELDRIFQYPRPADDEVGLIRHWDEHRDHTHIRFACDDRHNVCTAQAPR